MMYVAICMCSPPRRTEDVDSPESDAISIVLSVSDGFSVGLLFLGVSGTRHGTLTSSTAEKRIRDSHRDRTV